MKILVIYEYNVFLFFRFVYTRKIRKIKQNLKDSKTNRCYLLVCAEANMIDCDIIVSEFELQSHYYVYFRTNTPGKNMNPFILPSMD